MHLIVLLMGALLIAFVIRSTSAHAERMAVRKAYEDWLEYERQQAIKAQEEE